MNNIILVKQFLNDKTSKKLNLSIDINELEDIKELILQNNGFSLTPEELSPYHSIKILIENSTAYSIFNIGLVYRYNIKKDEYDIVIIKK